MNIGIIGCGLIGNKRALNINASDQILSVCDIDVAKAKNLSNLLLQSVNS